MKMISSDLLKKKAKRIKYFFTDVDGTLTNGVVFYTEHSEYLKAFSLIDGTGFYLLKKLGIEGGIITGEDSAIVKRRAEKLQLNYCILNASDKYRIISDLLGRLGATFDDFAYIGDDLNDLELLKSSALSFCPANAADIVSENVDFVCKHKGGEGAFREAVEIFIKLRQLDTYQVFRM